MNNATPSRSRRAAALEASRARALARTPAQSVVHGAIQSLPFLLVIVPFGLLFGVVATNSGLNLAEVMGFTVLVLAGASQFTAVQLMTDHAPIWLVILSSLAVNLRMAMYSASLVPWLGAASGPSRAAVAYALIDQTYVLSIDYFQNTPKLSLPQRLGYFTGTSLVMCGAWILFSMIGATAGRMIPAGIPLDFAIPITFLAMIAPALRSPAHIAAATVAVIVSLFLVGLPAGVGPMIAALLAMATGAAVETVMIRRRGGSAS
ncbi:AzlC family ABC transporter permease [Paracoccus aerodenitrificans]|uniref:AzlC family ABC transporter permease n=1 Tax=Paracoccus aerodenitrificans TaxID=3017781 RepID=UPI0022EFEA40|nr:AzlC family ABC transporter permease [Paracoccus aerodenitrificans]WBU64012.1 AzlC family ABC transporter permease [Paracoccus aerodenitrificans]